MKGLAAFALAYTVSAGIQKGLGFLLLLWVAYVLAAEDFAVFGLLWALQVGVATLAGAGITECVVGLLKDHPTQEARERLQRAANGVLACLGAVACMLAAIVYLLPIWNVDLGFGTQVSVLVGGLLTAFFVLHANLVRLEERHAASIALGTLAPLVGLLSAFAAFFAQRSIPAFYTGMAVGLAAVFMASSWSPLGYFRFTFRSADTSPIRRSLSPYVVIALLSWVAGYGYTYVVGYMFSAADVARFAFAYTLSSVMHLVATSMNQVWSPLFFRLVHVIPTNELEARNLRFFAVQGVALGVIGAAMLAVLPVVIDWVGGNLRTYRDMQLELIWLLSGYAAAIPWWHSQNYYLVHGLAKEMRDVVLVTTAVGLVVWLALMGLLGPIGIYAGFAAQMLIRSMGTWFWARKHWPIRIAWHGPAIACVLLLVGGFLARMFFSVGPE